MSEKKYFWIKLKTDFFDLPAIDWLAEQSNGYAYIVLYQKLCLLTANNCGELAWRIGEMIIPYDAKKIAGVTGFDFDTVVVALKLYKRLGLVYEQADGVLRMSGIDEMVGAETKWAEKKRRQRQRTAALSAGKAEKSEDIVPDLSEDIVRQEIEIDIEIEKEIDKDIEIEKEGGETSHCNTPATGCNAEGPGQKKAAPPPRPSIPYEHVKELYNSTCISLPKCTKLSDKRRDAIRARFNGGYTMEDFGTLFTKAEASRFLKGANDRNWRATFDWLVTDSNMAKVLGGNYDDFKGGTPHGHDDGSGRYGTWV